MTVKTWLTEATKKLEQAGIGTARLDALVLLEDATGRDRAWLLAHPEYEVAATKIANLEKLLKRRVKHEPLAYLRGRSEFYGREFIIGPGVLEPRPESEAMIDCLKTIHDKGSVWRIADVGSGSGALGITAALELPASQVALLEIYDPAIKITKMNVDKFTLNISIIKSDLLAATDGKYDVLLCNLPYVPDNYQINLDAGHEPAVALFGGPDGLEVYRRLFGQLKELKQKPLYILCESLPPQHDALKNIAAAADYRQILEDDFIQVFKSA